MCAKILLLLCPLISSYANAASTYDQRQSGDMNVQVDLKDLRIIALMKGGKEEYVDYDYAYDYSEMTIKPQNGTTSRPLNVSSTTAAVGSESEHHNTTHAAAFTEQTTVPYHSTEAPSFQVGSTSSNPDVIDLNLVSTESLEQTLNSSKEPLSTTTVPPSGTDCRKGFVMNQNGECELKLHGPGNALMKLVKLSQKLKQRREDRKNARSYHDFN